MGGPRQHRVLRRHPAQPAALAPARHPSVTQAAQSTLVSPNSTSADPSACFCQCRVMVIGRSSSGFRPSGRVTGATLVARAGLLAGTNRAGCAPRRSPSAPATGRGPRHHRECAGSSPATATACCTCSSHTRPPGSPILETGAGSDDDLLAALDDLLPADGRWRHRHGSPGHGRDHVLPAFIAAVRDRARCSAAGSRSAPGSRSAWSTPTATTRSARSGVASWPGSDLVARPAADELGRTARTRPPPRADRPRGRSTAGRG